MKKHYSAVVEVFQKNNVNGLMQKVVFDFGDDLYQARQFVTTAEEALTRHNIYFEIRYKEAVRNDENEYK